MGEHEQHSRCADSNATERDIETITQLLERYRTACLKTAPLLVPTAPINSKAIDATPATESGQP